MSHMGKLDLDDSGAERCIVLPLALQQLPKPKPRPTQPFQPVMHDSLIVWVIYHDEREHPGKFVLRPFRIKGGICFPLAKILILNSLNEARDVIPEGLVCLLPDPTDPKEIVESWI